MTYTLQQAQQIISNMVRVNIIDVQILANTKRLSGEMKNRIFKKGLDSNEAKIGDYSHKSISFPVANMPNPLKFKGRKTIYAKNGYWEVRNLGGRQNSFVDLNFTGSLFANVTAIQKGDNAEIVVLGTDNAKKLAWNEKHFNTTIGEPSQKELGDFINRTTKSIEKEINKYLKP